MIAVCAFLIDISNESCNFARTEDADGTREELAQFGRFIVLRAIGVVIGVTIFVFSPIVAMVESLVAPGIGRLVVVSNVIVAVDQSRRDDGIGACDDGCIFHVGVGDGADFRNFVAADDDAAAAINLFFREDIAAQNDVFAFSRAFARIGFGNRERADVFDGVLFGQIFACPRRRVARLRRTIAGGVAFFIYDASAIDAFLLGATSIAFDPCIIGTHCGHAFLARFTIFFADSRRVVDAFAIATNHAIGTCGVLDPCIVDAHHGNAIDTLLHRAFALHVVQIDATIEIGNTNRSSGAFFFNDSVIHACIVYAIGTKREIRRVARIIALFLACNHSHRSQQTRKDPKLFTHLLVPFEVKKSEPTRLTLTTHGVRTKTLKKTLERPFFSLLSPRSLEPIGGNVNVIYRDFFKYIIITCKYMWLYYLVGGLEKQKKSAYF